MHRIRRSLLLRLAVLAAVLSVAGALSFGYLGWLHPAFDSFSHFRIHLAAGLIVLALPLALLRLWPEAIFGLVLGATATMQTIGLPFATGPTVASADGTQDGAVYRLLQINLRYDNPQPERVLSLIGELRPDVITFNEVSDIWVPKLELLTGAYPYRLVCGQPSRTGGVAILSRRPFADDHQAQCLDRGAYGNAKVSFGGTIVEIGALHVGWPWPFEQPWQLPRVEPLLETLGHTAILAGDFNAVPWSESARRIETASGARLLRGIGPTWLSYRLPDSARPLIGLPIDQVLVKGGVVPLSVEALPTAGSDHLPVLLEFMVLPEEEPASVLQAANAAIGSRQ